MQLSLLLTRLYKTLELHKNNFVFRPLWIYWIILLGLTSYPSIGIPMYFKIQDKIEHLIAYFILSVLLQLTFHFQNKFVRFKNNHSRYTIIILIFYGIIDELHQYFIPGRYFDLFDVLANCIGIILATIVTNYFIRKGSGVKN